MKQFGGILAAGAVLAAGATSSLAQSSISYPTSTPVPSTATDWANTLVFEQFNSSLGTLDSVELQLSASLSTTLTVVNSGSTGDGGNAHTVMYTTVQDPGLNLVSPFETDSATYSFGGGIFGTGLAPGLPGVTSGPLTGTSSSDNTYYTSPILVEFTGSGTISLNAGTYTTTTVNDNGSNTTADQTTTASLTGEVIYDYTAAAPEPSTIGLLIFGLGALPFRRRQ